MDDYDTGLTARVHPLLVLSGLTAPATKDYLEHPLQKNGFRISSDSPCVTGQKADELLGEFLAFRPREGISSDSDDVVDQLPFHFKVAGRQYLLPCRKASPQASPADLDLEHPLSPSTPSSTTLHSPLSPLSPGSPIYPDGIFTPMWMAKYRHVVPAVFISFFYLEQDPDKSTLADNKLREEIRHIKLTLEGSKYRTRYAVVVLSDESPGENPEIDSRVTNIQRLSGLDPKNAFFYTSLGNVSTVELRAFVVALLSSVRPTTREFYTELTRHARRKRDKNRSPSSPPSTPGIQQQLLRPAWMARYEFKLGVFAEMRAELDIAGRHYTTAMEHFWDRSGVFDSISSWSNVWNQAREISDVLFIRVMRCLLWTGLTTSAARSYQSYRSQVHTVLERKGKGTSNYGWKAWEARMADIMATLVSEKDIADAALKARTVAYYQPEKLSNSDELVSPWQHLHHAGYWWMLSSRFSMERRALANSIPDEDRIPPGQSPATKVAQRHETYDTYLCPEPHIEVQGLDQGGLNQLPQITKALSSAATSFAANHQPRMTDLARFVLARENSTAKEIEVAFGILKPIWQTSKWRANKWWRLLGELSAATHRSSGSDLTTRIATLWELCHSDFQKFDFINYDLKDALVPSGIPEPLKMELTSESVHSFIIPEVSFKSLEGFAGSEMQFQVVLRSGARPEAGELELSELTIDFAGPVERVTLLHTKSDSHDLEAAAHLQSVKLERMNEDLTSPAAFAGTADLRVQPGKVLVLECAFTIKEQGKLSVHQCSYSVSSKAVHLTYTHSIPSRRTSASWWSAATSPANELQRQTGPGHTIATMIHPKPPKVQISVPQLKDSLYAGETVALAVELVNNEDEAADIQIEASFPDTPPGTLTWTESRPATEGSISEDTGVITESVGTVEPGSAKSVPLSLIVPTELRAYELSIKATYTLKDDSTVVTTSWKSETSVKQPFEAQFKVTPEHHDDAWPSYFHFDDGEAGAKKATGITTRWRLESKVVSRAAEKLEIVASEIRFNESAESATCSVVKQQSDEQDSFTMAPDGKKSLSFLVDATKPTLDERRSTSIDAELHLVWKRPEQASRFTTKLPVPRLNLSTNEPRCLAHRATPSQTDLDEPAAALINVTIENPSVHFLTFNIQVEPSETFAFSGPQVLNVSLVPLSRHTTSYVFYSLGDAAKTTVITPQLRVLDTYFSKQLKILGTGDLKSGEHGLAIPLGKSS